MSQKHLARYAILMTEEPLTWATEEGTVKIRTWSRKSAAKKARARIKAWKDGEIVPVIKSVEAGITTITRVFGKTRKQ